MISDNFNFFVPLELVKGTKAGQEMYIKGVCSSEVEDSDGETLVPAGYDVSALLSTGFLNYNHQAGKTASAIIGEPTKAEIVNNGKDLYLEGFLYPDSDEAKAVYKLAQTLEKNSSKRRLGFSIEGKALEKDPLNPKRITKARITGVAITAMPKNPNTLLSIMKGEYAEAFIEEEATIEKSVNIDDLITEYKEWTNNDSNFGKLGNVKEFFENYHEDNEDLIPEFIEKINKAMTAEDGDGVTSKESVEGGKKEFDKLQEDKKLKKSEVYNLIFEKYETKDIKKAQQIYKLTQEFNNKLYNMTGEGTLSKAVEKTFEFIDKNIDLIKGEEAKAAEDGEVKTEELVKSEETVVEDTKTAEKTAEELEKAEETEIQKSQSVDSFALALIPFIKGELEKGESEDVIVGSLVSKGLGAEFSTSLVKGCVEEMSNLKENGSIDSTKVTAAIQKSEEGTELLKSEQIDLIKGELISQFEATQKNILGQLETRFTSLGKLMKSQGEEIIALRSENQILTQNLSDTYQTVRLMAEQPMGTKSIIKSTQVERFGTQEVKNNNGKEQYNLQKGDDVVALTARLSSEYDLVKSQGGSHMGVIGDALFELSIAKQIDRSTYAKVKPHLDKMGIEIL